MYSLRFHASCGSATLKTQGDKGILVPILGINMMKQKDRERKIER